MPVQVETCANCGSVIGAMETPYIFKEQTVCGECYPRLSRSKGAAVPAAPVEADEGAVIPDSEFAPPMAEAVRASTYTPMKAALLEKIQKQNKRGRQGEAAWVGLFALVLLVVSLVGLHFWEGNPFSILFGILGAIVLCLVLLYLPVTIAESRNHPNLSGVRGLTILSIFIPILWIVAIVWAYSAPDVKN